MQHAHRPSLAVTLLLIVGCLAAALGCSRQEPGRCDLHGTITFNGKPIPAGSIVFEPDASRGNHGASGFAVIKGGRYDTRQAGKRIPAGPVTLWVSGFDGTPGSDSGLGKPLFPTYTMKRDVSPQMPTLDVDVPAPARSAH